jgi:hypothetical protein
VNGLIRSEAVVDQFDSKVSDDESTSLEESGHSVNPDRVSVVKSLEHGEIPGNAEGESMNDEILYNDFMTVSSGNVHETDFWAVSSSQPKVDDILPLEVLEVQNCSKESTGELSSPEKYLHVLPQMFPRTSSPSNDGIPKSGNCIEIHSSHTSNTEFLREPFSNVFYSSPSLESDLIALHSFSSNSSSSCLDWAFALSLRSLAEANDNGDFSMLLGIDTSSMVSSSFNESTEDLSIGVSSSSSSFAITPANASQHMKFRGFSHALPSSDEEDDYFFDE